jgi:hypothetical protein
VINFDDEVHQFEFPCHSRVSRKARKKKKIGKNDAGLNPIEEVEEEELQPAESSKRYPSCVLPVL